MNRFISSTETRKTSSNYDEVMAVDDGGYLIEMEPPGVLSYRAQ